MSQISKTATFGHWMAGLSDIRLRAKMAARIDHMALGNPSHVSVVGEGLHGLWIDYDLGYRVYFGLDTVMRAGRPVTRVVLMVGGDRSVHVRALRTLIANSEPT